jgi:holo-ACP synthase/triphosphoribosyl-dephospho-CoA synthase
MAERREARAARQAELIKEHGLPVVCFTMNIAGPHKYSEGIETCFNVGLEELAKGLSRFNAKLVHEEYVIEKTGCEAFLVYSGVNAKLLKAVAVKVEEETGFSRLFDIDVIDKSGDKLSRAGARKCLICGENAAECARSRKHSVEELQEKTGVLIREAVAYAASMAAYEAMVSEVVTTPKAGLVDRNNNGANDDMDIPLFLKSAETLAPYFYSMAYLAADPALNESGHGEGCGESENINCADCPSHEGCSLDRSASLMTRLTILGVEAEARMKEATGGVNTHKGAIFCLGLLVTAFARLTALEKGRSPLDILEEVKRQAALRPEPGRGTNGFIARERFGASAPESAAFGADAQARAGFPAAAEAYRRMLGFKLMGFDENDSSALSLIGIMAELYDTNAYSRAGSEGAEFVRERAKEIAGLPLSKRLAAVMDFDRELIARNINCGGAADMLAAAIFLDKLNKYSERRGGNEPHEHHHD